MNTCMFRILVCGCVSLLSVKITTTSPLRSSLHQWAAVMILQLRKSLCYARQASMRVTRVQGRSSERICNDYTKTTGPQYCRRSSPRVCKQSSKQSARFRQCRLALETTAQPSSLRSRVARTRVHRIPLAYTACIVSEVRRRAWT